MTVRLGKMRFAGWQAIPVLGGYTDTFRLCVRADAGLPPRAYAQPIRRMVRACFPLRRSMSLWVQVESKPGYWYRRELRNSLRGLPCPVAVLNGDRVPDDRDFSFRPWTDHRPSPPPPAADPLYDAEMLDTTALRCLQVLARLQVAYTAEIGSLADLKPDTVRPAMWMLAGGGFVEQNQPTGNLPAPRRSRNRRSGSQDGSRRNKNRPDWSDPATAYNLEKYPFWNIRRPGVSLAFRSWGIPAGVPFPERRERAYVLGRQRRLARMWPSWLKEAWTHAEVWAAWTEAKLDLLRPDVLMWGSLWGEEMLIVIEIERGNKRKSELRERVWQRFRRAQRYARGFNLPLVFVVLSRKGARRTMLDVFGEVPGDTAVVLADWRKPDGRVGRGARSKLLPVPEWGAARSSTD